MKRKVHVIVSRHPAAIKFLRSQGIDAPVVESATLEDVEGKVVAGNLPLHLAAFAELVYAIEFSGNSPRRREYTVADMEAAGAKLVPYRVEQWLEHETCKTCKTCKTCHGTGDGVVPDREYEGIDSACEDCDGRGGLLAIFRNLPPR